MASSWVIESAPFSFSRIPCPFYLRGMIVVTFLLAYPWPSGTEWHTATLPLWPGYECRSAEEAVERIRQELEGANEDVGAEILHAEGESWGFYRETVKAVMVTNGQYVNLALIGR